MERKVKGGVGEVKHRKLLEESYALGHNSFSVRCASWMESSRMFHETD